MNFNNKFFYLTLGKHLKDESTNKNKKDTKNINNI